LAALLAGTACRTAGKEQKPEVKGSIHPAKTAKPADLPSLAKISFREALTDALAVMPGAVVKAELEIEDGCLMYSFEIVGMNRKIKEVEIDAGNGRVLGMEDEEDENDNRKG
jgi:uncharacterized membrane protein YkoI